MILGIKSIRTVKVIMREIKEDDTTRYELSIPSKDGRKSGFFTFDHYKQGQTEAKPLSDTFKLIDAQQSIR